MPERLLLGQVLAHVERNRNDDDDALNNVVVVRVDAQELEDDLQQLEYENADENAADSTDTAGGGDAANGAGRDGFELIEFIFILLF